ncbi:MAG: hypothetical protein WEB31_01570, partial [Chthoniobacterales bacterium]
ESPAAASQSVSSLKSDGCSRLGLAVGCAGRRLQQLAALFGCSRRHIERLRKMSLPDIKVGELVRFWEKGVLEWLEFQRRDFGGYGWVSEKQVAMAQDILARSKL